MAIFFCSPLWEGDAKGDAIYSHLQRNFFDYVQWSETFSSQITTVGTIVSPSKQMSKGGLEILLRPDI